MSDYAGIDYGLGQTNIDQNTGIRYGVIPAGDVCQAWSDSSEPDYGEPTCPVCGNTAVEWDADKHDEYKHYGRGCDDYACEECQHSLDSQDVYGEEPLAWTLDDGEYQATQGGDDTDIFVLKSPYYTHAQFCSPCAPGAGYLRDECPTGPKTYCFGHDWFEDGKAPYTVYRVADDSIVLP